MGLKTVFFFDFQPVQIIKKKKNPSLPTIQTQVAGQIWPMGCNCMPTLDLVGKPRKKEEYHPYIYAYHSYTVSATSGKTLRIDLLTSLVLIGNRLLFFTR